MVQEAIILLLAVFALASSRLALEVQARLEQTSGMSIMFCVGLLFTASALVSCRWERLSSHHLRALIFVMSIIVSVAYRSIESALVFRL